MQSFGMAAPVSYTYIKTTMQQQAYSASDRQHSSG
jgi:hypothetical protein